MTISTSVQTPTIAVDSNGRTHIVWNQNNVIYHSYFNPTSQRWVEAVPIANSVSSKEIKITTDVSSSPQNSSSAPGVFVSWIEGEENNREVKGTNGIINSLGQFDWSEVTDLTNDSVSDENIQLVTTKEGKIVLISEKVDRNNPQADIDLYTQVIDLSLDEPIHNNIEEFNPLSANSFRPNNALQLDTELDGGDIQVPGTFLITKENSRTLQLPLSFFNGQLEFKNAFALGGGFNFNNIIDGGDRSFSAFLQAQDELTGSLSFGKNKLSLKGRLQGKAEVDLALDGDGNSVSVSDSLRLRGEYERNLLPGKTTFDLSVGFLNESSFTLLAGEVKLGVLMDLAFTLKQKWGPFPFDFTPSNQNRTLENSVAGSSLQLNTLAEEENPDLWFNLVRADGTPAQPGDDPNQLYWMIDTDRAADEFFAPPNNSPSPNPSASLTEQELLDVDVTNTGIITFGIGLSGKLKLQVLNFTALDFESKLEILANVEVFPEQEFTSLQELLTLGVNLFGKKWSTILSVEQGVTTSDLFVGINPNFIEGTSAIHAGNPIDANISSNLTDDTSPSVAIDKNGNINAVWVKNTHDDNLSQILFAQSTNGENWSTPLPIPNSQGMNFDPVIEVTSSGQIVTVWSNTRDTDVFNQDGSVDQPKLSQSLGEATLLFSVSNDGVTWTEPLPINSSIAQPQSLTLKETSDGEVLVAWVVGGTDDGSGNTTDDRLFASFWNGNVWSEPLLITSGDLRLLENPVSTSLNGSPTVFWTEVNSSEDVEEDDQIVSIYSSSFDRQFNQWESPVIFKPDVSNLATPDNVLDVIEVSNDVSNQVVSDSLSDVFSQNRIIAENDARLFIPHDRGGRTSQLEVSPVKVRETDAEAVLIVRRTGDVNDSVSFNYRTVSGSATAGADFVPQTGSLTFAPGEEFKEITIPLLDDNLAEKRLEQFKVIITSDHPQAHRRINGLRVGDGRVELVATITTIEDEPTELGAIDSGFILKADPQAMSGMSISPAGDINGDGVDDFLVGAPGKNDSKGVVYVVFGSSTVGVQDQELSLDNLDGSNGLIINGTNQDRLGSSIAFADLDGDNRQDLILGAPQNSGQSLSGKVYIVQGANLSQENEIDLNSTNALVLESNDPGNALGFKVVVADVTGDGIPDVIVSAPASDKIYVVNGTTIKNALNNNTPSLNLDELDANSVTILDTGTGQIGTGLGTADVNGDGIKDLLLGSPQANPVDFSASDDPSAQAPAFGGQVSVVFGGSGLNNSLDLSQLNGSNGFTLNGEGFFNPSNFDGDSTLTDPNLQPNFTIADSAGTNVVSIGDVNNDGVEDFIISASNSASGGINSLGRAYVIFGKTSGWSSEIDLANLNINDGFAIEGINTANIGGNTGFSVSGVGDVNNDLFDDFLISAPTLNTQGANSANGQSYLIFGGDNWSNFLNDGVLKLSDVNTLNQRVFVFNNPLNGTQLGIGLGAIGDVNNDGSPDFAMATPQVFPDQEESNIFVAFGHEWVGPGGSLDVTKLRSDNGTVFQPPTNNEIGTVSLGGDINGDGYADTVIVDAGFGGSGGQIVYLSFGSDPMQPSTLLESVPITINNDGLILGSQTVDSGDFNNDGVEDFIVARSGSTNDTYATVIFGNTDQSFWSSIDPNTGININDLLTENGGVQITVPNISNQGDDVNLSMGDFNGDGVDDVLVNSANLNPFIIFGDHDFASGTVSSINVLNQSLPIQTEINFPISSVSDVGDVNGDGFTDFALLGIDEDDNSLVNYLLFGSSNLDSEASINLNTINGNNGVKMSASVPQLNLRDQGAVGSVQGVGDINGDGVDDFVVGITNLLQGSVGGEVYVIFGDRNLGDNSSFDLNDLNGNDGFLISTTGRDALGFSVTGGGDINGDGYDDLVIGAPSDDIINVAGATTQGTTYTVFGGENIGESGSINVEDLDGANGFASVGARNLSFAGTSVGQLKDVNGDGFADMGIGAQGDNSQEVAGLAYNVFGGDFTANVTYQGTINNDILSATQLATESAPHIMNGGQGNDVLQSAGVNRNADGRVVMKGGQGNDLLSIGSLLFDRMDGGSGEDTLQLNSFILSSNNLDLTDRTVGSRIQGIEIIDLGFNNRVTLNLETLTSLSDTTNTFKVLGHSSFVVANDFAQWIKQDPVTIDDVIFDQYINQGTRLLIQQDLDSNGRNQNVFQSTAISDVVVNGTESDDVISSSSLNSLRANVIHGLGGDDLIDVSDTQGEHIIHGGAGLDRIIVSKNDTAFGSLGDDTFEALENSENNILHGDEGNDTFLLGKNNQAFGGQGRDRFFMQGEGKNLVWGGQDIDEFWIADQDFPSSFNAIMDFELGVDTIGLKGFAGREEEIKLFQFGTDTLISLGNQHLARVQGINPNFLQITSQGNDLLILAQEISTITVTNTNDSGNGSLRQAIIDANNTSEQEIIDLSGIGGRTIQLQSPLPTIVSDLIIQTAGPLGTPTIKAPNSQFNNIFTLGGVNFNLSYANLQNGFARGGDGVTGGGGGLGAGGAIDISNYFATVTLDNIVFDSNQAVGGNGTTGARGGGGEFAGTPDDRPQSGGNGGSFNINGTNAPGLGGSGGSIENGESGGRGGNGGNTNVVGYGGGGAGGGGGGSGGTLGGSATNGGDGGDGGFGGFGAGGGAGGGGGGAGPSGSSNRAGNGGAGGAGGSFAGNGTGGSKGGDPEVFSGSSPGNGGTGGGGAGLGGALFIQYANVTITNSIFSDNRAQGGSGGNNGQGLGGAIFIDDGNSTVTGSNLTFNNNSAPNSEGGEFAGINGESQNNNDVFGTIKSISSAQEDLFAVPSPQELERDSLLTITFNRFRNNDGGYLYTDEIESRIVGQSFPNFIQEGSAFKVSTREDDNLIRFNRFQNSDKPGSYLYAGEAESVNIRENFPNFVEEGIAFYAYAGNADVGTDFFRFQNTQQPGVYIYVAEEERNTILENFPQFTFEGVAFEALG
ncbi:Calx-beta domain-containing protein [Cyanobacterium aponinum UTEX 3222]|uniref:Calx-beta domain-containing protein n=1 Tax=Cyanobacterium aponinum TaxID=379064 RepID=UPI003088A089|nr:Calx-beta domain-containing protein [Cyanobacterium aponinum UTEX 3222]